MEDPRAGHTAHLPPHKVNRISVWRDEVVAIAAAEPSLMSPTPSAASSSMAAASSRSSSGASSVYSRPRRSIWRRLTRRLSAMGPGGAAKRDRDEEDWDRSARTEMYRDENRPLPPQDTHQNHDHDPDDRQQTI